MTNKSVNKKSIGRKVVKLNQDDVLREVMEAIAKKYGYGMFMENWRSWVRRGMISGLYVYWMMKMTNCMTSHLNS